VIHIYTTILYLPSGTFTSCCLNACNFTLSTKEQVNMITTGLHRGCGSATDMAVAWMCSVYLQLVQTPGCPVVVSTCQCSESSLSFRTANTTRQVGIECPCMHGDFSHTYQTRCNNGAFTYLK